MKINRTCLIHIKTVPQNTKYNKRNFFIHKLPLIRSELELFSFELQMLLETMIHSDNTMQLFYIVLIARIKICISELLVDVMVFFAVSYSFFL